MKNDNCNNNKLMYIGSEEIQKKRMLFNNLPELIRLDVLAKILGISKKTLYDWRYRRKTRNLPEKLFVKICGNIYARKDVLCLWIDTENASP